MKTIFRILFFVGVVLTVFGCGGNRKNNGSGSDGVSADSVKISLVAVEAARMQDVPQTDVFTSTVQAFAVNNIAPQAGGRIERIHAEVGDFVSQGKVLAEMNRSQLDQARLKLVNDSTEFGRLKQLYDEGGLSKSDLDAIEMSLKVSRSAYRNLLENTLLRSPISGVVSARNYDRGDMYAGQPIFVVQQITPVKLLIGISETDYTKVHVGDAVEITADALPGEIFTGKIKRVYPTIDPATHTVTTEIQVTNADRKLRPGMFAKVKVEFSVNHSVTVPDVAVVKQQGSGQRFVFVLNGDSTVSLRIVTLGRHFGTSYEILDGLQEGEVVVTKGQASLKNGSEVQVMDE
jgi:RND family efflux transporter MFP subunit